jgi:hypothetical protein
MTYINEALRRQVIERAENCCEYCHVHQDDIAYTHEVDHIIPEKHKGKTQLDNLCLACLDCNRHKGSDFATFNPETDEVIRLFNPRKHIWGEHFRLEGATIVPLSLEGQATVFVLKLNDDIRIQERKILIDLERYPC